MNEVQVKQKVTPYLPYLDQLKRLAHCERKGVGAIALDSGFKPLGMAVNTLYACKLEEPVKCSDRGCTGATVPSSESYRHCRAIHAEINLLNLLERRKNINRANYMIISLNPCMACVNAILSRTAIHTVIYTTFSEKHSNGLNLLRSNHVNTIYLDIGA